MSWADQWDNNQEPLPIDKNKKKTKDESKISKIGNVLSLKWVKEMRKKSQK